MPVHVQNIGPAIIVEVKESTTPTQQSRMGCQPCRLGIVLKQALAMIAIKIWKIVGEVGLENIQQPVAVVVPSGSAHSRLVSTITAGRNTRFQTRLREGPVAIIPEQKTPFPVVGHIDIRPAIVIEVRD